MYSTLLTVHSLVRWLILAGLLVALIRAYRGWLGGRVFSGFDNAVRYTVTAIAGLQLIVGLWLYIISPFTAYFFQHYSQAVHDRQLRFFGMEHITMMVLAIVLLIIGSYRTAHKSTDTQKFKTMAVWFSVSLFIILVSIPWQFSPIVSRPLLRGV